MNDLISRQAAVNELMKRDKALRNINWYDKPFAEGECKGIDDALEIINALPSAQPERRWISCSERLPEEAGWYLCTYKDGRVNTKYWSEDKGWVDNIRLHMFELYDIRSRLTKEKVKLAEESIYWDDWVKAWMPLPEPYKGD